MNVLDQFRLDGKVAVVTGGAGRIGRVLCRGLAEAGCEWVVIVDTDPAGAELVQEMSADGLACVRYEADVTDRAAMLNAGSSIQSTYGLTDILVNAATAFRGPEAVTVNIEGTHNACIAFACKGSTIINFGSTYGVVSPDKRIYGTSGLNAWAEYSAGKAGVIGLTKYLACHWAHQGIRVNCLVPGGVYTGQPEDFVQAYSDRTPMGRMARAEELVGPVLFLASDASSYMTGAVLTVDGGWTAW